MSVEQRNNAPTAGQGDGSEDQDLRGTIEMSIAETKYQDYTCRIGEDLPGKMFFEEVNGQLVRFYCQFYRVPSRKEFVLRFYAGADVEDRRRGERMLRRMPEWTEFPTETWFKRRHSAGYYFWKLVIGRPVENPLVQLELEMMIDLDRQGLAA